MLNKKTIKDIDLKDKTVLVRVDFNVPMKSGKVADDFRVRAALPTIKDLIDQHCRVVLMSHLGRPKGKKVKELSLKPVASLLGELLGKSITFIDNYPGEKTQQQIQNMDSGQVALLENIRYNPEDVANDHSFAKQLAQLADVFVLDAFGTAHRDQASVSGVSKYIPAVAGFLVEKEMRALNRVVLHPSKPLLAIIGGAKIATKIALVDNLMQKADTLVVGGAMANTFLVARGFNVGKSLYDAQEINEAKKIITACANTNTELILPIQDVAVTKKVEEGAERREIKSQEVADDDIILDFGHRSTRTVLDHIRHSKTVIWNGPLGMTELKNFSKSSEAVAKYIVDHEIDAVVGGGDTAEFIHSLGLENGFSHVSTGGGASLEVLSGGKLPAVEALLDK